jgi:outer membrane protein TolC
LDGAAAVAPPENVGGLERDLARLAVEAAQLDAEAARNEWRPTVALSMDAGLLTSFDNLQRPAADRSPMLGASAALRVDWPLFAWGLRGIHMRQKALGAEAAEWQARQRERAVQDEWRKAMLQWSAAREHREALRSDLAAARDNFALTKSKYAGGSGLASEVLDAHKLWIDTQSSLLQAEADLRILSARLRRLGAREGDAHARER